jgi:hypothetical protein
MSIGAIGGVSPMQGHALAGSVSKPESSEVPGVPDHDGDADDAGTKVAAAPAADVKGTGGIDLKA